MATLYSDRVATSTNKLTATTARSGINEVWDYAEYELSAALALNDVIQMVKVPAGATVVDLILSADDLDSDGSPAIVLDVGDGASADRYIDGSDIGQAGGVARLSEAGGHLYEYAADDTIDVLVQVAPATGATSGSIKLAVCFSFANLI